MTDQDKKTMVAFEEFLEQTEKDDAVLAVTPIDDQFVCECEQCAR
jgi:siroheme synthase (precorrin-2 oxidase/ferrochelatase)